MVDVRRRMAAGAFAEAFPTDQQMVREYGVSRHTVREAVSHLVSEGLLERRRHTGSRLRSPEFEQPLGSLYSLFRSVEDQGVDQTSRVRALDVRRDPAAATHLELADDASLVYLERVRLAGGVPLALDQVWLPGDLARPILDADFSHTALYDELARRCDRRPVRARELICPVIPSAAERRLLGLDKPTAALGIERTSWTEERRPLEWRNSVVRGDRYSFVAEWSPGSDSNHPDPSTSILAVWS